MDVKKVGGIENLGTMNPSPAVGNKGPQGASFRDTLSQLQTELGAKPAALQAGALKFSNHAVERMQSRGIRFTPESMQKLSAAVEKAAAKGSKDTLLLTDEAALIVSVKNRTVVTVMDKDALKENVFTNIDSTVVI